jgi:glycosyltransferase involved in cell wall biosynthesis
MSRVSKRYLIISHGHPDINKGGAEVAAYNMYQEMRERNLDAYFLARTDLTPHGGAAFSSRNNDREILFHTTMDDWFLFSNIKTRHMWQEFRDLLLLLKPDVVHLHHYFLLGIEMLEEIRRTLPESKIVLTLHEYLAICHNKGLMVKTNDKLCYKANSRDCHGCFPDKQPGDFFLREQYIKRMFNNVDVFVSPSQFLKDRYIDWGIPDKPFFVIENGQVEMSTLKHCDQRSVSEKVSISFFGQVNPYKGIDVLIEAILFLPKRVRKEITVNIHGANLEFQEGGYQKKVAQLLEKAGKLVKFHGAYERNELPMLLSDVDWVVVPSIWWENSPMVIQEAFSAKVPLIVSDIGGMAEKVVPNVNGLYFRSGKAQALADKITQIVLDRTLKEKMQANILPVQAVGACLDRHLEDCY